MRWMYSGISDWSGTGRTYPPCAALSQAVNLMISNRFISLSVSESLCYGRRMNVHAQALGRLARGKPKVISEVERKRRAAHMRIVNARRLQELRLTQRQAANI